MTKSHFLGLITFQSGNVFYYSKKVFLNHKIVCSESYGSFEVPIPSSVSFGNFAIKPETGSDVEVSIKYELKVSMETKKSLRNLFGLFGFNRSIPLTISPQPLYSHHEMDKQDYTLRVKDEKFKMYGVSAKFYQILFFPGEKSKFTVKWRNPSDKKESDEKWIHKIYIELTRILVVDCQAPERVYEGMPESSIVHEAKKRIHIKNIPLGTIANIYKSEHNELTAAFVIPRDTVPNELNPDEFHMEYQLRVTASTYDYQIKGPFVDFNIHITSPPPSSDRLSEMQQSNNPSYGSTKYSENITSLGSGLGSFSL